MGRTYLLEQQAYQQYQSQLAESESRMAEIDRRFERFDLVIAVKLELARAVMILPAADIEALHRHVDPRRDRRTRDDAGLHDRRAECRIQAPILSTFRHQRPGQPRLAQRGQAQILGNPLQDGRIGNDFETAGPPA